VAEGSREVTAVATHFGFLSLLERTLRPVVTGLEWPGDGRLVLRGDYGGQQDRPAALVLRHVESGRQYTLPLRREGGTFTTGFAPSTATGLGDPMPLAAGDWLVLAPAGTGGAEVAVALDRRLLPSLPGYHRMGPHEVEAGPYNADALRLHARLARADTPSPDGGLCIVPLRLAHADQVNRACRSTQCRGTCGGWYDTRAQPRSAHRTRRCRRRPRIRTAPRTR
jgi:hypothetical protein